MKDYTRGFREGAKALFDYLYTRAVNNYHGNEVVNEACEKENEVIFRWITDALASVSPKDHEEWLSITELNKEILRLKQENLRLQKEICTIQGVNIQPVWLDAATYSPPDSVVVEGKDNILYYMKNGVWYRFLSQLKIGLKQTPPLDKWRHLPDEKHV